MNLLNEAWIPVRRKNGVQDWIAPWQIGEPDIVALDARRPDFNGALVQFLVGLAQTTTPMNSHAEWQQWYDAPPSVEVLKNWFAPVESAFVFDGDGARFMQDFSLRTAGVKDTEFNDINALLIEAPGDNTLKENKDHFIKRGFASGLCSHCAAMALFTLQTNAPSGGNGHFTSLRGGGPLTTLIIATPARSLWHTVWLNVRERDSFLGSCGDAAKTEPHFIFPWLAEMHAIQAEGGKTAPIQVHPAHVFWGMPRRIRLDQENTVSGHCDTCGRESGKLLTRYITKPKGFNYKGGWNHPLSPYYEAKDPKTKQYDWLPVHPQPGGIGYKDWLGLVLGVNDPKNRRRQSSQISHVLDVRNPRGKFRLWVFGYDMDNMKARCWYDSTFPLYGLVERNTDGRKLVQSEVAKWIDAADHGAFLLKDAIRSAWFSKDAKINNDWKLWEFVLATFWSRTESVFYQLLQALVEQARDEDDDSNLTPRRELWRKELIDTAKNLFDADFIGAAPIERQNPRRIAEAYNRLRASLYSDQLKEILKLPVEKKDKPMKKSRKASA
ncbi:MAG: type I-E CRISPR-associated protein Cse1/CasA [Pseudomonadota bacterium]|nr:type I-E CRISPR-associated protein Cse1/CasA [Pseudomonadota bacterium]